MKPVILIPGLGGSILVRKGSEKRQLFHKSVPANRWINIYSVTNTEIEKWRKEVSFPIKYDWNGKIKEMENIDDVYTYDFGGTNGIKDIIPEFLLLPKGYHHILDEVFRFRYFHPICDYLHKQGYVDHETLFGAPYDFRLILNPKTRKAYFRELKKLIEESCHKQNKQAIIVSHSLGGIIFKWFLSEYAGQEWVDKYIHKWICISSPFGGSYQALRTVTCGDHYVPSLRKHIQSELRYITGIIMCMPNTLLVDKEEPLLHITGNDKRIITVNEYNKLADENMLAFQIWKDLYEPNQKFIEHKIKVSTDVFIGNRKETYGVAFTDRIDALPYRITKVNGDGTVSKESLLAIEKVLYKDGLREHIYPNHDHTSLLSSYEVMQCIHKNI